MEANQKTLAQVARENVSILNVIQIEEHNFENVSKFPSGFKTRLINLNEGKYNANKYGMCVCAISHWNLFGYLNLQVANTLL